jgi:hypothetical protein
MYAADGECRGVTMALMLQKMQAFFSSQSQERSTKYVADVDRAKAREVANYSR